MGWGDNYSCFHATKNPVRAAAGLGQGLETYEQ